MLALFGVIDIPRCLLTLSNASCVVLELAQTVRGTRLAQERTQKFRIIRTHSQHHPHIIRRLVLAAKFA